MLLCGISCTKVLHDKCTGLGGHGQVCTDWTDWRICAWAYGYMIQPLCLFSRLKITTLPLSLCRSRERNTGSSQTGPDTVSSILDHPSSAVPSRKLETPAGQGHTKEAMWLIFTAIPDSRRQMKPLCFYIAWNNRLWSQSSSGGRGGVLEHSLYINYLILVTKQKLLSLFFQKLKCGSKGYCTPQGLCSRTVAGSELVAWLWDCPSDTMSTIYSMSFLSIVPPISWC